MSIQTYQQGELILAEGTYGMETFLIKAGQVTICKDFDDHHRVPIATLSEGEMFGEMCLFEEAGVRTASVIAKTEVQVELIPHAKIEAAIADTPELIQALLKTLSSRLAQTSQQNLELQTQRANG